MKNLYDVLIIETGFVGSEMSHEFNSYIEGAIRSGIRVANEFFNKD